MKYVILGEIVRVMLFVNETIIMAAYKILVQKCHKIKSSEGFNLKI